MVLNKSGLFFLAIFFFINNYLINITQNFKIIKIPNAKKAWYFILPNWILLWFSHFHCSLWAIQLKKNPQTLSQNHDYSFEKSTEFFNAMVWISLFFYFQIYEFCHWCRFAKIPIEWLKPEWLIITFNNMARLPQKSTTIFVDYHSNGKSFF